MKPSPTRAVVLVLLNCTLSSTAASKDVPNLDGNIVPRSTLADRASSLAPRLDLAMALLSEASAVCHQDPGAMGCPDDATVVSTVTDLGTEVACVTDRGMRSGRSCLTRLGALVSCTDYVRGRQTGITFDCVGMSATTVVNGRPTGFEAGWSVFPHGRGVALYYREWKRGVQDGVEYERIEHRAEGGRAEVVRITRYQRGKENGPAEEWTDGRLSSIRTFKMGKQTGLQVDLGPDGTIQTLEIWRNGKTLYRSPSSEGVLGP